MLISGIISLGIVLFDQPSNASGANGVSLTHQELCDTPIPVSRILSGEFLYFSTQNRFGRVLSRLIIETASVDIELEIAADGTIRERDVTEKIAFSELPIPVQDTVHRHVGTLKINDVERRTGLGMRVVGSRCSQTDRDGARFL